MFLKYYLWNNFFLFIPGVVLLFLSGIYNKALIGGILILLIDLIISIIKTRQTIKIARNVLKNTGEFEEDELEDLQSSLIKFVEQKISVEEDDNENDE